MSGDFHHHLHHHLNHAGSDGATTHENDSGLGSNPPSGDKTIGGEMRVSQHALSRTTRALRHSVLRLDNKELFQNYALG